MQKKYNMYIYLFISIETEKYAYYERFDGAYIIVTLNRTIPKLPNVHIIINVR